MAYRQRTNEEHQHAFGPDTNRCACGGYRMTPDEYHRRCIAWDEHYKKCKDTESAASFSLAREAWDIRDYGAVKQFALQAKERLANQNYLPQPAFIDPRCHSCRKTNDGNWIEFGGF